MKYFKILFFGVVSLTMQLSPMDRPEKQEGAFAQLPPELQEKIILGLVSRYDSSGISYKNVQKKALQLIAQDGDESNFRNDKEFNKSRKYILSAWRTIWNALHVNKSMQALLSDDTFSQNLFLAFIKRLFAGRIAAIDLYNEEIISIANQLKINRNPLSSRPFNSALRLALYLGINPNDFFDGTRSQSLLDYQLALVLYRSKIGKVELDLAQLHNDVVVDQFQINAFEKILKKLNEQLQHIEKCMSLLQLHGAVLR